MAEEEVGEQLGGYLVLGHASKRSSGRWEPDDYDVLSNVGYIGRIFKPRAGVPEDFPLMWTITVAPRPAHPAGKIGMREAGDRGLGMVIEFGESDVAPTNSC
jgi:hypothetical protein